MGKEAGGEERGAGAGASHRQANLTNCAKPDSGADSDQDVPLNRGRPVFSTAAEGGDRGGDTATVVDEVLLSAASIGGAGQGSSAGVLSRCLADRCGLAWLEPAQPICSMPNENVWGIQFVSTPSTSKIPPCLAQYESVAFSSQRYHVTRQNIGETFANKAKLSPTFGSFCLALIFALVRSVCDNVCSAFKETFGATVLLQELLCRIAPASSSRDSASSQLSACHRLDHPPRPHRRSCGRRRPHP